MTGLNIVQLMAAPFPSHQGSQVYMKGLSQGLVAAGHTVAVAAYGYGQGHWPEGVGKVPVRRLPVGQTLASGPHVGKPLLDAGLAWDLARFLRRERVDVIHAHNAEAPLVAWLALKLAGQSVPVVYDLHTSLEEELPVYFAEGRRRAWAKRLGRRVDGAVVRRADVCLAISEQGAEVARRHGARRVAVVSPGVNLEELEGGDGARARERWKLPNQPIVLYTGNTDAYQDLEDLFLAMKRLPDAHLLVVTGSDVDTLLTRIRAVELPQTQVTVVGSRHFGDTLDAMAVADVAALPRTTCAGFPIKLLNTLGAGLVTVAARGASRPLEGVIQVPDHNPTAFAAALDAVISDPFMRDRLGQSAKRAVAANWSWSRRAERVVHEVYGPIR